MSMALMVAMASRKRDDNGRYAEDNEARRMGNDHSTRMGGYDRGMTDRPEMRRRRDDRGRYMEGSNGADMAYHPWPEPHMPPYLDRPGMNGTDMRGIERMRDKNIVNIRDYQDRRNIGFRQADDGEGPEMRQYGRRYDPDRPQTHYGAMRDSEQRMGRAEAADDHLSEEEAEEWVAGMHGADGSKGGRWKLQEIKQYAANFGIQGEEQVIEFFAIMNALYTDYCKVAKKYGVDKVDFWADLAKAFMHDKDARPGKIKMYYECIAKHDD